MATLEDKILGEKLQNYCSSSEESDNEDSGNNSEKLNKAPPENYVAPDVNKWEGTSTNTGPKGVIEDWRKFKQLENEKKDESKQAQIELAKKLTMTVRTALDEEREKAAIEDPELAELLNDEFLLTYQKKRMQEMLQTNHKIKFGELIFLRNSQEFLDSIDKEDKTVTIIIHIYEDHSDACRTMNICLKQLCKIYPSVKFSAIIASEAGVSRNFKDGGIPALLVYKSGNLIGNFVRLTDDLGNDFQPEDVQSFLIEHGLLEDKSCKPVLIKCSAADSDTD